MIDPTSPVLSISAQCDLLSVNRSRYYYVPVGESQENLAIMRQLDEQYFLTPFYGALRLTAVLIVLGYKVNVKRVRRLMKLVDWKTIYREPRTTVSQKRIINILIFFGIWILSGATRFGQWTLRIFQ